MQFIVDDLQLRAARVTRDQSGEKVYGRTCSYHAFLILRAGFDVLRRIVWGWKKFGKVYRFEKLLFTKEHSDVRPVELVSRHTKKVAIQFANIHERMRHVVNSVNEYER